MRSTPPPFHVEHAEHGPGRAKQTRRKLACIEEPGLLGQKGWHRKHPESTAPPQKPILVGGGKGSGSAAAPNLRKVPSGGKQTATTHADVSVGSPAILSSCKLRGLSSGGVNSAW